MLSVDGDVDALAECIRVHLSRTQRWGSPVYLAGKSYGTTRGADLADKLLDLGIALAGVILVSCAMDIPTLGFEGKNDLAHALFVPGFAAAAQYHGKLKGPFSESGAQARAVAEAFVQTDYLAALYQGARLAPAQRSRIAKRLAELTGLRTEVIADYDLGTPYSASDYSLARTDVSKEVMARITHRYYDAGRMVYTRTHDLKKLKVDLKAWLA